MPRARESRRATSTSSAISQDSQRTSVQSSPAPWNSQASQAGEDGEPAVRRTGRTRKRRRLDLHESLESSVDPTRQEGSTEKSSSSGSVSPPSRATVEIEVKPLGEPTSSGPNVGRDDSPASDSRSVNSVATSSKVKIEDEPTTIERFSEVGFESTQVQVNGSQDLQTPNLDTQQAVQQTIEESGQGAAESNAEGTPTPVKTGRGRGRPKNRKKTFPPSRKDAEDGASTPSAPRATRATVTLPPGYIVGIKTSRLSRTPRSDSGAPDEPVGKGRHRFKPKVRMHGPLTKDESERRDEWLRQLEEEEKLVEDETHPVVIAVRSKLKEEKDDKIRKLKTYLEQVELEYGRQLEEATSIAWRRWADDKYELRLSMYLENHEKLKQLYAEEKDYSFIQDHPLFRDFKGIPEMPFYRAALGRQDKSLLDPRLASASVEPPPFNPAVYAAPVPLDKRSIESDLDVIAGGARNIGALDEPSRPKAPAKGVVVRPPNGPRIWYAGPPPPSEPVSPPRQRKTIPTAGPSPSRQMPVSPTSPFAPSAAPSTIRPPLSPFGASSQDNFLDARHALGATPVFGQRPSPAALAASSMAAYSTQHSNPLGPADSSSTSAQLGPPFAELSAPRGRPEEPSLSNPGYRGYSHAPPKDHLQAIQAAAFHSLSPASNPPAWPPQLRQQSFPRWTG